MTFLKFVPLFFVWIKPVIGAVMTIEALFGSGLTGEEKKDRVLEYLRELNDTTLNLPWGDDAIEIVGELIDKVVWFLNKYGIFKHNDDEDPEAVRAVRAVVNVAEAHKGKVTDSDPELNAFVSGLAR
jgi:hypothetical protein